MEAIVREATGRGLNEKKDYSNFFIWQAIVRGQSVSTEGPFFLAVAKITVNLNSPGLFWNFSFKS